MGAVFHALSVPGVGGDTLFSDMYAAYDSLDDATKLRSTGWSRSRLHADVRPRNDEAGTAKAHQQYPPVRHPVVCTHPARESPISTSTGPSPAISRGLEPDASHALLDRLCRQADAPEHQCRFAWTKDAVAFWDNRAVQHYASSDYWPHRRTMERASIIGIDRPAADPTGGPHICARTLLDTCCRRWLRPCPPPLRIPDEAVSSRQSFVAQTQFRAIHQ